MHLFPRNAGLVLFLLFSSILSAGADNIKYPQIVSGSVAGMVQPVLGSTIPVAGTLSVEKASDRQASIIAVENAVALSGEQVVVSVLLTAQGDETALGFSLGFNPAELSYVSVSLGEGAASATSFIRNVVGAGSGKLGFAISLDAFAEPPDAFAPGVHEIVTVTFSALGLPGTVVPVTLANSPVLVSVSDADANELEVATEDGTVTISDPAEGEPVEGEGLEGESEGEPSVPHPADLNQDFRIVLSEAIAYLAGWQQGSNPIAYAIRAAYIWQNGEYYLYDALQTPPLCWSLVE